MLASDELLLLEALEVLSGGVRGAGSESIFRSRLLIGDGDAFSRLKSIRGRTIKL
jgi:hypothetical protein